MREQILMIHPAVAAIAMIAAAWIFAEVFNASDKNKNRIWYGSLLIAFLTILSWVSGGYWYVTYYAADKATILNGPLPWAHNLVMETKEHLFFITLILALLLPLVVRGNDLLRNRSARSIVLTITALFVLTSFAIEGAGAMISMGVRAGLEHPPAKALRK